MKEKYSGKSERKRMIRVKWESSEMMFYKKASILFTQRFATFHHREPWWCMKVFLSPLLPWKYSVIYSLWLYLKFLRFVDLPFFFFVSLHSSQSEAFGIQDPNMQACHITNQAVIASYFKTWLWGFFAWIITLLFLDQMLVFFFNVFAFTDAVSVFR